MGKLSLRQGLVLGSDEDEIPTVWKNKTLFVPLAS